ncbi:hypothetical protein D3C86_1823530 [compost metagenome]
MYCCALAGDPPSAVLPSVASSAMVAGLASAFSVAALSACTTAGGVPAGATITFQSTASNPA